jgi:hypothetical protein
MTLRNLARGQSLWGVSPAGFRSSQCSEEGLRCAHLAHPRTGILRPESGVRPSQSGGKGGRRCPTGRVDSGLQTGRLHRIDKRPEFARPPPRALCQSPAEFGERSWQGVYFSVPHRTDPYRSRSEIRISGRGAQSAARLGERLLRLVPAICRRGVQ